MTADECYVRQKKKTKDVGFTSTLIHVELITYLLHR